MYQIFELNNKAKVIFAPRKETEAVILLVMFDVGSRDEARAVSGVSHFIEHLFFKGTKKRPNTQIITQELDKIGASFNAFTGKDYTGYYIKVAKDKAEVAFDILSDMLFNSLFKKSEIDRERGVIVEEIKMYRDNPLFYIGDLLEETVYQGHQLGRDIGGTARIINNIPRAEIIKYRDSFYEPKRMTIGLAGNISKPKADQLLNKYFKKKFGKPVKHDRLDFIDKQKEARIKVHWQKTEQVQMSLGFISPGRQSEDYLTQVVLATILGGNMSSRLFINVRERHGLAYSIRASIDEHQDISSFQINVGLAKQNVPLAYKLIIKELNKIKKEAVDKEELDKAKDYLKGKLSLSTEDSFDYISWLIKQYIELGIIKDLAEVKKDISKVTAKQVQALAEQIFKYEKLNLAVIGPYKDLTYFNKMIKQIKL